MSKSSDRREKLIARLQLLGEQESTETAMFHQAAAASYGLGITDMKALQIVLREGPQTAGELAMRLRLTTGAVTSVLDRLERQSLIIRSQHPEDRRRIIVSANTKTLADGDNVYRSIGGRVRCHAERLHNLRAGVSGALLRGVDRGDSA